MSNKKVKSFFEEILNENSNEYKAFLFIQGIIKNQQKLSEYNQLKIISPSRKSTETQRKSFSEQVSNFLEEYSPMSEIIEAAKTLIRKERVLDIFLQTREPDEKGVGKLFLTSETPNKVDLIYQALRYLSPGMTELSERILIADFIYYEVKDFAKDSSSHPINRNHLGIFGTGGDKAHTINISTISSLIAALMLNQKTEYLSLAGTNLINNKEMRNMPPQLILEILLTASDVAGVVKIGTGAVTGKFGSAQVAEAIKEYYPQKSMYLSLADMGFPYSTELVDARKRLNNQCYYNRTLSKKAQEDPETLLDIYKEVFPLLPLRFDKNKRSVTGIADKNHIDHMIHLADGLGLDAVFIRSEFYSDEILAGENEIIELRNREVFYKKLYIGNPNDAEYKEFITERNSREEQIKAIFDVINGNCPESVIEVFSYNVAILIMSEYPGKEFEEVAVEVKNFLAKRKEQGITIGCEGGLSL